MDRRLVVAFVFSSTTHALLFVRSKERPLVHDVELAVPEHALDAPALEQEPPPEMAATSRDAREPSTSTIMKPVALRANPPPPGRINKEKPVPPMANLISVESPAPGRDVFAELSEGDPNSAVDGLLYGEGSPGRDLSRPPSLGGPAFWDDCPWPASANEARINHAAVVVTVDVTETGVPTAAQVVLDAGHDFGQDAVGCAMRYHYRPGRDKQGRPVSGRTRPFPVLFNRGIAHGPHK